MTREEEPATDDLAQARRTVEEQTRLIERLRAELAESRFADSLREILLAAAEAGRVAAPVRHGDVLEAIVETAAAVLEAQASSLFLLDEERDELVFQVALGTRADEVRHFRVPLGHGIAGYVAATGQPLAVANVENDPRFAREIGEAVDYRPSTILCVPLFLRDRVVGVLELLNKRGGTPFTPRDMETLGRFGNLAALAIEQSRLAQDVRHLFRSLLRDITADGTLSGSSRRFADLAAEHVGQSDAFRLAELVHELGRQGDAPRRLALDILTSLSRYVRSAAAAG
ncbi:MAG: GAF domain-containing protein [Candidatus Rokuibacteriota bacterium]